MGIICCFDSAESSAPSPFSEGTCNQPILKFAIILNWIESNHQFDSMINDNETIRQSSQALHQQNGLDLVEHKLPQKSGSCDRTMSLLLTKTKTKTKTTIYLHRHLFTITIDHSK